MDGKGGHAWQGDVRGGGRGMCGRWVCMAGGCAWQGCVCQGCVWQGACMAGGMRGEGGACVAGKMAIAAGGTHPTVIHSCL